jgi:hypothetical protein
MDDWTATHSPGAVFYSAPAVLDLNTSIVNDDSPGGISPSDIGAVWRVGEPLDLQIVGREGLRGQGAESEQHRVRGTRALAGARRKAKPAA